ncbi:MAG: LysM peptidoglycan-binding domain-containing protein [Nitriliruptorales bacterium]|nr:LysM peptidoglycan-binding domain-containing protein [Nitriliruptorales bacterium]
MSRVRVDGKRRTSRILWGRIAMLLLVVAMVFVLGRWSAADEVPLIELEQAEQRIHHLERENRNLQEQLRAQEAGGIEARLPAPEPAPPPQPRKEPPPDPAPEGPPPEEREEETSEDPPEADAGDTYVVQPGDTLQGIAQQIYGDGGKFPVIAQANDIEPRHLAPGQELRIPADPERG